MEYEIKRKLVELSRERRDGVSDQKGKEYTKTGGEYKSGGDVLANFKRNAERFGQNPFTVLGIYLGKHFDSVENFIKELDKVESYEDAVTLVFEGEGIISRLDDVSNYIDLLEALLFEYQLHPYAVTFEGADVADDEESYADDVELRPEVAEAEKDLAAEVEEAATNELANFVGPSSPFKGSREVGNG